MSFVSLWQRGYVIEDIDKDALDILKAECMRMLDSEFVDCTAWNNYLVGSLKDEYLISDVNVLDIIKPSILKAAHQYLSNYSINYNHVSYCVNALHAPDVWANFQRKGEFNAIHYHAGDLSFVIYVQVPFKHEDENVLNTSITGPIGGFNFYYPDFYARGGVGTTHLPVDATYEGKIILFPSDFHHSVHPFLKSDGIRVSVAGNLTVN